MTTQQAQDVVKAVYSEAYSTHHKEGWFVCYKSDRHYIPHYIGKGDTEHAAWLSAASQITGKTIQP